MNHNIEKNKKEIFRIISQRNCGISDLAACPKDRCLCNMSAEISAYCKTIIPDGYDSFTLFDFDGQTSDGELVLSSDVVFKTKAKIARYCWNDISDNMTRKIFKKENKNKENIIKKLREKSIINAQRHAGRNVVIFGNEKIRSPSGKTMAASIIMREAIRNRINHIGSQCNYSWVHYQELKNILIEKSEESIYHESSDWLVVDDIIDECPSVGFKQYLTSMLDPFFIHRYYNGLPTILVFRFDINEVDIESKFGNAISKICNDSKTTLVNLSND